MHGTLSDLTRGSPHPLSKEYPLRGQGFQLHRELRSRCGAHRLSPSPNHRQTYAMSSCLPHPPSVLLLPAFSYSQNHLPFSPGRSSSTLLSLLRVARYCYAALLTLASASHLHQAIKLQQVYSDILRDPDHDLEIMATRSSCETRPSFPKSPCTSLVSTPHPLMKRHVTIFTGVAS